MLGNIKAPSKHAFFSCRDSKALKDENLPPVICQDVENLQ